MARPFSSSFLAGDARAAPFLRADFRDEAARAEHVRRASARRASPALLSALAAQQRALPKSAARERALEQLARGGTAAVVTGQQVGLFLGPLYTVYKAATAIAAARALTAQTGTPCVAVFWLQTEDHDFPEIQQCRVLSPHGEPLTLSLQDGETGAGADRVSVKHRRLGPSVEAQLLLLESTLRELPHAAEALRLLRAHYRPQATLAEGFAGTLAELFAEEGLLFLDPREPEVAALAAPLHARAVAEREAISAALHERARALEAAGFEVQVHVREGSPLSFFHPHGPRGPRCRLDPTPEGFALVGLEGAVSREALAAAAKAEPLCFSSSALLRPVIQDALLPTAAYVGGPGEANYFAQLPPLYPLFDLPVPMFLPRARFRVVEPRVRALLETLQLRPEDAEQPAEALLARTASRVPGDGKLPAPGAVRDRIWAETERALGELDALGPALDEGTRDAVLRTRKTVARALERFTRRYERALLTRDEVRVQRLARLRAALYPDGAPQERVYGLPGYLARSGWPRFKQVLFEALRPFAAELRELSP